jgi:prepilin-type N-terminal cleavage/methylation domain-containing protein
LFVFVWQVLHRIRICPFIRPHNCDVTQDGRAVTSIERNLMSKLSHVDLKSVAASHVIRSRSAQQSRRDDAGRGRGALGPRASYRSRPVRAKSDEDGFTLVELLVVVLVLATLVGIAVPTFAKQRESAWDAAVSSELRTAMIALESYRSQNAGYDAAILSPDTNPSVAGWGYEPSSVVQLRYAVETNAYCLIAWYDPDSETISPAPGFVDVAAPAGQLWGVKSSGAIEPVSADFCTA